MLALLRRNLQAAGFWKTALFCAGCFLFAMSGRIGSGHTFEQQLLSAVSDHYYLTYFMLPMLILFYLSFAEDDPEIVQVRFKSFGAYFCRKWAAGICVPFLMLLMQTCCIAVSGIGLAFGNVWADDPASRELAAVLERCFGSPLAAFAAYTGFQFFGSWFLCGICMWICHFAGQKRAVKILAALYVPAALWLRLPALQTLPLAGLNHFVILHHNLGSGARPAVTGATAALVFGVVLYTVHACPQGLRLPRKKGLTAYYMRMLFVKRNILIFCAVIFGDLVYKGCNAGFVTDGRMWVCHLFSGHGVGYFRALPFLEMLVVSGTPLYLIGVFAECALHGQSPFSIVRARGRRSLIAAVLTACAWFLLFYGALWFAGGAVSLVRLGYGMEEGALLLLLEILALKLLELLARAMLLLAVYLCTKRVTAGFLAVAACYALCILPAHTLYVPFGISSTLRLVEFGGEGAFVLPAFFVLAAVDAGLFAWQMLRGAGTY